MSIRVRGRLTLMLAAALVAAGAARAADEALIAAAKKEGTVTWYSTNIIDQFVRPVAAGFEKKYGIKVEYVRASSTDLAIKVSNEARAGRMQADVVDGMTTAVRLKKEGHIMKWQPQSDLPKRLFDPEGYWVATTTYTMTPGRNTEMIPDAIAPKTYEDLLDPRFKGKMVWNKQPSSTSAQGFIGNVLMSMGEAKGRDYLARLAKQQIAGVDVSARQVLAMATAGEFPIAMQIPSNFPGIIARKGAPVVWVPLQPALAVFSVASITEKSPHPNAAKLLIEYLISIEAQTIIAAADEVPIHPGIDIKDPAQRPDPEKFKLNFVTPEELEAKLPAWSKVYDELFK